MSSRHPGNEPSCLRAPRWRAAGFGIALLAGWTATVHDDGATWFGWRGPTCPLGACLGPLACPGCGLLRSTATALHGDLPRAFTLHPTGPVVAALLVLGAVLHFDILRRGHELPRHRRARTVGHAVFTAARLLGWLLRLLRL